MRHNLLAQFVSIRPDWLGERSGRIWMRLKLIFLVAVVALGLISWFFVRPIWFSPVKTSFDDIKYSWVTDPMHGEGINMIFEGQTSPGDGADGISAVAHNLCVAYAPVMAYPILRALKKHDPAFLATTIVYGQGRKLFYSTHFFLFDDGKTNCEQELLPSVLRTDGAVDVTL